MLKFDPEEIPIVEDGEVLPAVPSDRLTPQALRARFSEQRHWRPEIGVEMSLVARPPACAAVLLPLVARPQVTVLLTRRNDALRNHGGEISFPGGSVEPDDTDAVATALREACEEIGLRRTDVEVIGSLPLYVTVSAFHVTPVVALVRPGFPLHPNPNEVTEVFEVPLAFLMDPAHHRRHVWSVGRETGHFFSMPYQDGEHRYFIWGVTAGIIRNLYRFLVA